VNFSKKKARIALKQPNNPNFLADIPEVKANSSNEDIYREVFFEETENLFVETIMKELAPKFKIIPEVPYKTIVGVTRPENLEGITQKWKDKFRTTYGHTILEDTEVQK